MSDTGGAVYVLERRVGLVEYLEQFPDSRPEVVERLRSLLSADISTIQDAPADVKYLANWIYDLDGILRRISPRADYPDLASELMRVVREVAAAQMEPRP